MIAAKTLLKKLAKTQEEQAEILGIDQSLISRILAGKRPVSPRIALKIAKLTNTEYVGMPNGKFGFRKAVPA